MELAAFDANGGPCYIGTGCFHRRKVLCGLKYTEGCETEWKMENERKTRESASVLEESCKVLASCAYEENTQWGKEVVCFFFFFFQFLRAKNFIYTYMLNHLQMGLKYDCAVEDIITGFLIQCRGWKSAYLNPERKAFLGAPIATLLQSLVQHKRWAEGHFQMFISRYNTIICGHKKIPLRLQLSYTPYALWAPNCLATLYYIVVPSLSLLGGISLFPEVHPL